MIQEFEQIRVLIAHDGVVHWEPGGVFHVDSFDATPSLRSDIFHYQAL